MDGSIVGIDVLLVIEDSWIARFHDGWMDGWLVGWLVGIDERSVIAK